MFDTLIDRLGSVFDKISGTSRLTEANIRAPLKEVQRALLHADVNYQVVKNFIKATKEKVISTSIVKGVSASQMLVKAMHDELVTLLGSESSSLSVETQKLPAILMVVGLQGVGKTTLVAKLGKHLKKKGRNPLLVSCDIYRPAAIQQLKTMADQAEVSFCSHETTKNVLDIAKEGIAQARENNHDTLLIDTAGRLQVDEVMMNEVKMLKKNLDPKEILFVVDGTIGQEAVKTAKVFDDQVNFDGVVVTKMDGDSRGGAILSVKAVTGKPIKFISQGESLDDLTAFYPERIANRILGMGDIVSLVEKVEDKLDKETVEKLGDKFLDNTFTLEDFLSQIGQMRKLGSMSSIMGMMPGMSKMKDKVDENKIAQFEAIILSMTREERQMPRIINGKRQLRIANGSGCSVHDVGTLLKRYQTAKKMAKSFSKKGSNPQMLPQEMLNLNK